MGGGVSGWSVMDGVLLPSDDTTDEAADRY